MLHHSETGMEGDSSSGRRGRGRGTALSPLALRRSLFACISSPGTSEVPRERGGRAKKAGRGGRAGGGCRRGRRTATPSSPPPSADSPEHKVDPSPETPVHQPSPVVEEATSQSTSWGVWPEGQTPVGEVGAEEPELETADEAEGGEGTTVYQRGGTRLPPEPVTPAHKSLITPDGET